MTAPAPPSRIRRALQCLPIALAAALLLHDLRIAEALSYRGERAGLVPILVIIGLVLCGLGLRVLLLAGLGVVAAIWLVVAFTPLDRALADGMPRVDPLGPADAIYVLASDVQPDGDLTTESLARLNHGIELVGQGFSSRLVVGELAPPHGRFADAARRLLGEFHLQAEVIGVGPVETTREEGVQTAALFHARGWQRVIVVTSPMHSRRAAAVFEAQGLTVLSAPTREAKYNLEGLASPDERLRAFPDILHERLGIWIYRRRGWVDP